MSATVQASHIYSLRREDAVEFVKEPLPPRKMLLNPFLAEKTLGMIHAWRGVGKTHIMLGMGAAQASGGAFLKWQAPEPSRVLYVDGEMAAEDIQLWLREQMEQEGIPAIRPGMFNLIAYDRQEQGIPSLFRPDGQELIEEHLEDDEPTTIYLDNISSLFRGGDENEGMWWEDAQEWLLSLRRRGHSAVLGHHDGKGGFQRGTSSREDSLNWVIQLRHPKNYEFEEGLRVEIRFEKARRLYGLDARPFEASLVKDPQGKPIWVMKEMQDAIADAVRQMHEGQGM